MKFNQICEHIIAIDPAGDSNTIIDMNNNVLYNGIIMLKKIEFREKNIE
jgi:hypothetical protein